MPAAPGQFIISLDCEGKWGMADHITAHHNRHLTHANLVGAYRSLVSSFARYETPATFAFVMLYLLDRRERAGFADRIVDIDIDGANWLRHFRAAEQAGDVDGWFCPEALDIVRASPEHEIACHGFCHVPLANGLISSREVVNELRACQDVARLRAVELQTFVYPRNQVGHLDELAAAGFKGFRDTNGRPQNAAGRVAGLASEFNIFSRAEHLREPKAGMEVIPAGNFLNWQRGLRRLVPRRVSRLRWKAILQDAADTGGTAHIWLHPHNLIDGPGTLERLEDVLAEASYLRDSGRLDIITMAEYVRRRQSHLRGAQAYED